MRTTIRTVTPLVIMCLILVQAACFLPGEAWAEASQDLKNIVYKSYFRGDYEGAIDALRTFLEREDLSAADTTRAMEYLAASLILGGAADEGRDVFLEMLKADGAYGGPDPAVFKAVVVDEFNAVQSEFASVVLRNPPETPAAGAAQEPAAEGLQRRPFYKKWWFYASVGAAVLLVAGAAAVMGDDASGPPTGTVTVEVDLP